MFKWTRNSCPSACHSQIENIVRSRSSLIRGPKRHRCSMRKGMRLKQPLRRLLQPSFKQAHRCKPLSRRPLHNRSNSRKPLRNKIAYWLNLSQERAELEEQEQQAEQQQQEEEENEKQAEHQRRRMN